MEHKRPSGILASALWTLRTENEQSGKVYSLQILSPFAKHFLKINKSKLNTEKNSFLNVNSIFIALILNFLYTKDPPPASGKRAHSVDGKSGILAQGLKEMKHTLKELNDDRQKEDTRTGILGTALHGIRSTPCNRTDLSKSPLPPSLNVEQKGMIANLLENKDQKELENLGLKVGTKESIILCLFI
uniref:Uncharacterized protein n=1 Tax=Heterorhabditis bacteriophora TaxID=37862 RepID=A0A1I7WWL3_HETBA